MSSRRKTFSNEFKARVALEAIKGFKTISEISGEYQVHPNIVSKWKKEVLENLPGLFDKRRGPRTEINNDLVDKLYKQIGKQQVELDWLKKKLNTVC